MTPGRFLYAVGLLTTLVFFGPVTAILAGLLGIAIQLVRLYAARRRP